jgi:hypothetical protein
LDREGPSVGADSLSKHGIYQQLLQAGSKVRRRLTDERVHAVDHAGPLDPDGCCHQRDPGAQERDGLELYASASP